MKRNSNLIYSTLIMLLILGIIFLDIISLVTLLQTENFVYLFICIQCTLVLALTFFRIKSYIEADKNKR